MFIRARLRNVGLHALALSLVAGGFLPSSALAIDVTDDLPSISFPSRHDADSSSQTIRMTSANDTDSAITSITAVAPNSFAPSAVDAKASCSNPIYASLCQELKNNMGGSTPTTPTGWQTVYSGSGTSSHKIDGTYSSFRGTLVYTDYDGVNYTKSINGAYGATISISDSASYTSRCTANANANILFVISNGWAFNGTTSVDTDSCRYDVGDKGGQKTVYVRAQITGAKITKLEVYR